MLPLDRYTSTICGTIRCQASDWSRKCVLTDEMSLSTENIRKVLLARQTQEKVYRRNVFLGTNTLFMDVITESRNTR